MLRLASSLVSLTVALGLPLAAQEVRPLRDGWELAIETQPGQRPELAWRTVSVPGTFEDALGSGFDGTCWYRRGLDLRRSDLAGATFRLLFRGVATHATVYCNGQQVGEHLGAWTPWRVELTPHLRVGGNRIEVRVDERVGHNTQGFLPVIQPHFGGLWRSVDLEIDRAAQLDPEHLFTFGRWNGGLPTLDVHIEALAHQGQHGTTVRTTLLDGDRPTGWQASYPLPAQDSGPVTYMLGDISTLLEPWSPSSPKLYTLRIELFGETPFAPIDTLETKVGLRDLRADGTSVLWNGSPLQVRGMLHWGYSPPAYAPPEDPGHWRPQLEAIKAMGCNLLKCCLWMPPRCVYELCDEIGLLVWQEYPTWHPTLTEQYLPELRQEYEEFHRYDRSHPSVAFRSLTCETGHSAELAVIQALYDRCKQLVPNTLVVDDSAWISWHRVHDFYDDHPYGNNSWWPGKVASMKRYIAERDAKPLLLGECIASDTWVDFAKWEASGWSEDAWFAPWGLAAQRGFMSWMTAQFGAHHTAALVPESELYSLRNRRYQVERIRQSFPEAGYVLSVVRDITKCRMGLFDDFGDLKWPPDAWSWHGPTMLCLDTDGDRHAFVTRPGQSPELPLRIAHHGRGPLAGTLKITVPEFGIEVVHDAVALAAGAVSDRFTVALPGLQVDAPRRVRVEAELLGTHPIRSWWDLWLIPAPRGSLHPDVRVIDTLDAATIDWIRAGGRALLRAGERKNCLRTRGLWFLRGAPWAPEHALSPTCPPEFLEHLQAFDLDDGRVLHWESFMDQVDPLLAFWDTHDLQRVDRYLLAFTAGFGEGRLGATVLKHDTPAGQYVLEQLSDALGSGPAPSRSWKPATIDTLRAVITGQTIDLVDWQIALDRANVGLDGGWADGEDPAAAWAPIEAGKHWEAQGYEQFTGVAWYRRDLQVPADWTADRPVNLVFESVDDSYHLFVNGRLVQQFGEEFTPVSVFLQRTTADIRDFVTPGETARIVLRVVDHVGAGGVNGRVFVTTGPVAETADFVH